MNFAFFRVQRREVAGPSAYLTCLDRDVRRQNEKSDGGRCRYFSRFARVERLATESAAMNQAESELSPKLNVRVGAKMEAGSRPVLRQLLETGKMPVLRELFWPSPLKRGMLRGQGTVSS